jgi:hypothetical protein
MNSFVLKELAKDVRILQLYKPHGLQIIDDTHLKSVLKIDNLLQAESA